MASLTLMMGAAVTFLIPKTCHCLHRFRALAHNLGGKHCCSISSSQMEMQNFSAPTQDHPARSGGAGCEPSRLASGLCALCDLPLCVWNINPEVIYFFPFLIAWCPLLLELEGQRLPGVKESLPSEGGKVSRATEGMEGEYRHVCCPKNDPQPVSAGLSPRSLWGLRAGVA